MTIKDIKKGDIVTYRGGTINYVNKPNHYKAYYTKNFQNKELGCYFDIVRIERYVKCLWFYRLKTIYRRDK